MRIELLYPEISNLYGDAANLRYFRQSYPDCELLETTLGERPRFLGKERVDLVYRGTMTESAQRLFIDELRPYRKDLRAAIEAGQDFLITGNALEPFGTEIRDSEGESIPCLGIFPYHAERDMLHRFNSLYVGKYGDMDIVGYKSQFGHAYYDAELPPLFTTVRGPGFHPGTTEEGVHYRNFRASYLIGPLLVLNPGYLCALAAELGVKDFRPLYEETAMAAFRMRLEEYSDPGTGFSY